MEQLLLPMDSQGLCVQELEPSFPGLESEELLRIRLCLGLVRMELKREAVARRITNQQPEPEDNRAIPMTSSSVLSREATKYGVCVIWEPTMRGRVRER